MAKKTIKKETIIKKTLEELLEKIGVAAPVSVSSSEDSYTAKIESEDAAGLLIGRRGETLNSLQLILSLMIKNLTGEWVKIIVNVADWRERQEDYIKRLAEDAARKVKETGLPQNLYNLSSYQRRIIHLALSEDADIETESSGEGEERYLIVKPKKK